MVRNSLPTNALVTSSSPRPCTDSQFGTQLKQHPRGFVVQLREATLQGLGAPQLEVLY